MFHVAARDFNLMQFFLEAEWQEYERDEHTLMSFRTHVSDYWALVDMEGGYLQSTMLYGHVSDLSSSLAQVAARIPDRGTVFHSNVEMQLGEYEETVQPSFHSILASLVRSLKETRRGSWSADIQ